MTGTVWTMWAQPLFWIMAAQWMTMPPLVWLAQDFVVPRHWGGLKAAILGVVVFGVVVMVVLLGPLYLLGYIPLPRNGVAQEAGLGGVIVGGLLSLPLRAYVRKRMRRRAGFY